MNPPIRWLSGLRRHRLGSDKICALSTKEMTYPYYALALDPIVLREPNRVHNANEARYLNLKPLTLLFTSSIILLICRSVLFSKSSPKLMNYSVRARNSESIGC